VLKELIQVLRGSPPLQQAVDDFSRMLELATELVLEASSVYAGEPLSAEERTALYEKDVQVNKLERKIRKNIVAHLGGKAPADVPYSLLLMSIVKDIERLGDFAKNLCTCSPTRRGRSSSPRRAGPWPSAATGCSR
jgi:phosphate uptake regulator